jgi:hypothetical protein
MPARCLNISPERCGEVPTPEEPKVMPFCVLARAMNSATVVAGEELGTTIRLG